MAKSRSKSVVGIRGALLSLRVFSASISLRGTCPHLRCVLAYSPTSLGAVGFEALLAQLTGSLLGSLLGRLLGRVWLRPEKTDGNLESDSEKIAWR